MGDELVFLVAVRLYSLSCRFLRPNSLLILELHFSVITKIFRVLIGLVWVGAEVPVNLR